MDHENKDGRDANGRWLPGTTGNAAGRGMTNRQRISERLLAGSGHGLGNAWRVNSGPFGGN